MATTGLFGPNPLTADSIDRNAPGIGPGTYALGHNTGDGKAFVVSYVGRSDEDLNARLKQQINSKYPLFKHGYFKSAQLAFERECNIFHNFGGVGALDNAIHPARPRGTDWKCPQCNACG